MSILIKGMKMPKDKPIRIVLNPNGQLFIDHGVHFTEYETVELQPHGRLIDAEELSDRLVALADCEWNQTVGTSWSNAYEEVNGFVEDAPTIIEAEYPPSIPFDKMWEDLKKQDSFFVEVEEEVKKLKAEGKL